MTPYEVLGIGAPFLDHVVPVSIEFVEQLSGQKGGMEVVDYETFCSIMARTEAPTSLIAGGSSANTIKGLANLGHNCALFGKIGTDPAGDKFLSGIKELGIIPLLTPTKTPTGQIACLVTPDGERTFRDYLGSGQELRAQDLYAELFEGVKLVHIEGYTLLNEDLTLRTMEYAKTKHAKISFDLGCFELAQKYKRQIMHLLSNHIDILFANAEEVKALTGHPPEHACAFLKDLCEVVVVSMGPEGCWIGNKEQTIRCYAYPVKPLDTTGAGDMFAAGFLHGYLLGKSLPECAHYGALIGAEVVQVFGAEIPSQTWNSLRNKID